jgi:hypothetical protein
MASITHGCPRRFRTNVCDVESGLVTSLLLSINVGSENCPKRHQTKEALILLIPGHRYPSDELRDRPPFHCIRIWIPNFQGICFLLSLNVLADTQRYLTCSRLLTLSHKVKPPNTVIKPLF